MIGALAIAAIVASTPDLGIAEGRCRAHDDEPELVIAITGLKDRKGRLRAELYPSNDTDFLQDDNELLSRGKPFRRAIVRVPTAGPIQLCLRAPAMQSYALSVVHDRGTGGAFSLLRDGIGFAGNPVLRFAKPRARDATVIVAAPMTRLSITMNYRRGFFSFGPIASGR